MSTSFCYVDPHTEQLKPVRHVTDTDHELGMTSSRIAGLANPGPVASALWTDPELEAGVALDGIVTVADARNLRRQLAAPPAVHSGGGDGGGESGNGTNEAQQQLAYSDVVLLNKVCLSDPMIESTDLGFMSSIQLRPYGTKNRTVCLSDSMIA